MPKKWRDGYWIYELLRYDGESSPLVSGLARLWGIFPQYGNSLEQVMRCYGLCKVPDIGGSAGLVPLGKASGTQH